MSILTFNCGSSSVKYAVWESNTKKFACQGIVERVGSAQSRLTHESGGEETVIDRVRLELSFGDPARDAANGANDLVVAAVGERQSQAHPAQTAGRVLNPCEQRARTARQPTDVTDRRKLDFVFPEPGLLLDEKLGQEAHQSLDLEGRARPVLGGKGVEGEVAETDLAAVDDDFSNRRRPLVVAGETGQPPRLRPSAVAVHDDRHVSESCRVHWLSSASRID